MPSVNFKVAWPDGEQTTYYSPSTIVYEHLVAGGEYTLTEFDTRIHSALNAASERVYKRFGYYCTAASGELEKINHKLQSLREKNINGTVQLIAFS
jgi:uncharacterized repeat protein (TIGR04042 family)